jgi:hypothetical protein
VLGFITIVAGLTPLIAFLLIGVAALGAVAYSLVEYKQLERRGNL